MPNSLKCRLKKLAHQGLLSENDLSRIYTDNDVITELEKIKAEFEEIQLLRDNPYNNETEYSVSMEELRELFDKHISELKGE